jgi:Mor family transcriptional regulator
MKADQAKTERNEQIYQLKATMTFAELAKRFNISPARVKMIYYTIFYRLNPGKKLRKRKKKAVKTRV